MFFANSIVFFSFSFLSSSGLSKSGSCANVGEVVCVYVDHLEGVIAFLYCRYTHQQAPVSGRAIVQNRYCRGWDERPPCSRTAKLPAVIEHVE